ncbi:MAG: hypothetical protein FJ144_14445 [Deltaproteobacteria bacterium]|nr:hypothetical protein [Deltaproteobacteria bacterium]
MSDLDCDLAAELLERYETGALAEAEIVALAAHLESCSACGALDAGAGGVLREGLRDLAEPLPDEAFFAARLAATMDAVAEKRVSSLRGPAGRVAGEPSRRAAVVGTIAAGALLALGAIGLLGRGSRTHELASTAGDESEARVEVVSVDGVDADELAASEDAWLVARYDSLELELAGDVGLEDLTDDELDVLEDVIGAPRSGKRS